LIRDLLSRWRAPRVDVEDLLKKAQAAQREQRPNDAGALFEAALAAAPGHLEALLLSARFEGRRGNLHLARGRLELALSANPNLARAHADLGNVQRLAGDIGRAAECYEIALALDPALAAARNNLGLIRLEQGDLEAAANAFADALDREPKFAEALRNLVNVRAKLGQYDALRSLLLARLARDDTDAEAHAAMGFVELKGFGAPASALGHFDRARELGHETAELLVNRGIALHDLGRLGEAVASYGGALLLDPGNALARFHRALARLVEHRFELAWDDYESRLVSEAMPKRGFPFPRWDGSPLRGKTVLILGEQGLGDEIMFASCFGEAIASAGHCIIDCAQKLEPIFRRSFPRATVHGGTQFDDPSWLAGLPQPDLQVQAGSLPRFLRRHLGAFPRHHGYLAAAPGRVEHWRSRLAALGPGMKVGVSWRGGTEKSRTASRSLSLEAIRPLLSVPGAQFVSLQYDAKPGELEAFHAGSGLECHYFAELIDDYDETAAVVASLDLVVSVCTAVIHLGGALGTPVWVMAPAVPEWRYGIRGEAMPWYPGNRVFRQHGQGHWEEVIDGVAALLRKRLV